MRIFWKKVDKSAAASRNRRRIRPRTPIGLQ